MEVLIAFCIVLVEAPRIDGGKSICNFYNPGVIFKSYEECMEDRRLIEDYVVESAWKMYLNAVKIYAKGICGE